MPGSPGAPGTGGANTPGLGPNSPLSPTTRAALAEKSEPTAWQIWWAFNQGRYLEFGKYVNSLGTVTFLGGDLDGAPKNSQEMIEQKLQPALLAAMEVGGDIELVNSLLVSVAKLGDPSDAAQSARFEFTINWLLKNDIDSIAETAAVALGILGSEGSVDVLCEVLADSPKGRELLETDEIGYRTRAFAAYAMGLIGRNSDRSDLKQRVVKSLVEAMRAEDEATQDVKAASMIALGLVRLDRDEDCDCKGFDHEPWTSRQALMWYLLEYFCKPRENPWLLRAHCATAMAKQLENVDTDEYKGFVVDALAEALKQSSREPLAVRQSCIIALGIIGDADDDPVDKQIRTTLSRMCGHAEEQSRRFALIAMGQVGGRPGDDSADPLGAAPEIRKFLLKRLASGKKGYRSWAALSLGIMGHDLAKAGEEISKDVTFVLRSKLNAAREPEDFGAYAISLGLRHDEGASKMIVKKMRKWRGDDDAVGNAVLALGMVGNRDATEKIQEILEDSVTRPTVHRQAAMALAMLGDTTLTDELLADLLNVESSTAERMVYATAISYVGDARHLDSLIKLLASEALDDKLRGFVVMALGQVADRELEPWNSCISCDVNYFAGVETLTNGYGTGIMDRR